ncbi:unnamed protein product [Hydatigera taeniaeformis]|uniref:Uncharacterized protein n=1 Tax=Hydatigena taeniaeformis TaxID=6205 RepID=A0A0R3WSG1_HYDTA|nr:unnamed protein product [Hydatigera taeniaeformis]
MIDMMQHFHMQRESTQSAISQPPLPRPPPPPPPPPPRPPPGNRLCFCSDADRTTQQLPTYHRQHLLYSSQF